MSHRCLAETQARIGKWLLYDGSGNVVKRVNHWTDLETHNAPGIWKVSQEEIGEELAPIVTLQKELGAGSFGRVFACTILMPDQSVEQHVIKIPGKLLKWGILQVDPQTKQLVGAGGGGKEVEQIRKDFKHEFENFEKIYEPDAFLESFGGGQRGRDINMTQLRRFQSHLPKHPGRKHIHEYLHFDAAIPAIVSSMCFDTLDNVHRKNPAWFTVKLRPPFSVRTSDTWQRVAEELGNAIDYVHSRGYVHTDIKPANVLVAVPDSAGITAGNFVCKLSDFGEIMPNRPAQQLTTGYTPFFTPPSWPEKAGALPMQPVTLGVYGFAATMAALLHIPQIGQPWPLFKGNFLEHDFQYLQDASAPGNFQVAGKVLFPRPQDAAYTKANPIWGRINLILARDYKIDCCVNRHAVLPEFLTYLRVNREQMRLRKEEADRVAMPPPSQYRTPEQTFPLAPFDVEMQEEDDVDAHAYRIGQSFR